MLSDVDIRTAMMLGEIVIDPPPLDHQIQPASIDVHLGNKFGYLTTRSNRKYLSESSDVLYEETEEIVLHPKEFLLGQLLEHVTIGAGLVARIEGKSSNGRKGVAIHVTAGFVDPGWSGILTVELFNASDIAYILRKGDSIGQLAFDRLNTPSHRIYGHPELNSHYQNSVEVRGA